jgi:hypothetical protein
MMLEALLDDLLGLEEHDLLLLLDRSRLRPVRAHPRVRVVETQGAYHQMFSELAAEADATLVIAPESGGLLEVLTASVEATGKRLLGSSSQAVAIAADKALTCRILRVAGVPTPETSRVADAETLASVARRLGYPVVLKPQDGAGCHAVCVARDDRALHRAFREAARDPGGAGSVIQPYIAGVHASVSLLVDRARAVPLTLNLQRIKGRRRLRYDGGQVPLEHPLRALAFDRALQAVSAIPGLRGYVGIDLVLTDREAVVIEVNPRLTTSYVGIRRLLQQNLAAAIIDAALGTVPSLSMVAARGPVRFTVGSGAAVGAERGPWFT